MASGQEDTYSYDLTASVDYEPQQYQTRLPRAVGVGGGRLNTPPPPATPDPGIGVGTNTNPAQTNVTVGLGGTRTLRQQTGRPPTPTGGGYLDTRPTVPAEATLAAEEVVVVAEGDVVEAEEEAEAEETMTMTTPMPHLLSDQVPLHVDEGDDGF